MANLQHLSWLTEGVEKWNNRRRTERFTPDLQGADISGEFDLPEFTEMYTPPNPALRGIDLSGADLRSARLENLDLSNANFCGACLEDAKLNHSLFRDSWFRHSRLDGAHLNMSNFVRVVFEDTWFRSADFTEANLSRASFIRCQIEKAIFHRADLSGTDFILTTPWEASLFSPASQNNEVDGFDTETICSIDRLLEECRKFRDETGRDEILYFRGESKFGRELLPSVMRQSPKGKRSLRPVEGEMLKELATRQPDAFNELESALGEVVSLNVV